MEGYACYFKKRFGTSKTDGCSICFKTRKFELLKEEPVDYFNPEVEILNRCALYFCLHKNLKFILKINLNFFKRKRWTHFTSESKTQM